MMTPDDLNERLARQALDEAETEQQRELIQATQKIALAYIERLRNPRPVRRLLLENGRPVVPKRA